jgi:medium-chain acyl-[acyl-carrier-protein] hydrolase
VLTRIVVAVHARLPRLGATLHVTTWPAPAEGLLAARHFRLHDDHGTEVAVATTRWLLIDAGRRRPLRIPPEMAAMAEGAPAAPLALPEAAPAPAAFPPGVTFPVLRRDLDMNGHATTTHYAEWLFEPVPDTLASAAPRLLDLSLRAETHRGDVLTAEAAETAPGVWFHRLTRVADGRVVAMMQTEWPPTPHDV